MRAIDLYTSPIFSTILCIDRVYFVHTLSEKPLLSLHKYYKSNIYIFSKKIDMHLFEFDMIFIDSIHLQQVFYKSGAPK